MKRIMMIAGPNGAGKTTIASAFTTQQGGIYKEFLNADKIAEGLSPLNPENVSFEAGKLMLERFHLYIKEGISFVFETTGASRTFAAHMKNAQKTGYEINLTFVWISSTDQAVKRVAQRVEQGGHNIPKDVIHRRYYRGLKNLLNLYLPIANTACIIDNSSDQAGKGKVIAKKDINALFQINDMKIWEQIVRLADVQIE